jgi:hypothetical protein
MQHHHNRGDPDAALAHVAPAVKGFFKSVALGQASGDRTGNLQDILRLLTLWFNYGRYPEVEKALQDGFAIVSIDTWLVVIPQARTALPVPPVLPRLCCIASPVPLAFVCFHCLGSLIMAPWL